MTMTQAAPMHRVTPWWTWIPVLVLCTVLLALAMTVTTLDASMRVHLLHVIVRGSGHFLTDQGTAASGFLSTFAKLSLTGLFVGLLLVLLRGKQAFKDHIVGSLVLGLTPVVCASLLWFGSLWAREIARVVYQNHTSLLEDNKTLATARDDWKEEATQLDSTTPMQVRAPLPRWKESPTWSSGPIGPIAAWKLTDQFSQLPRPCVFMVTSATDKPHFAETLGWLLSEGAKCEQWQPGVPSENLTSKLLKLTTEPGIVVHWREEYRPGAQVANAFGSFGLKLRTSHQLPQQAPANLIWIDIGPGNPQKTPGNTL